MTDYDDKETSIDDGAPYELYQFIGTYRSYYMTNDLVDHVYEGRTYVSTNGLKRSSIKAGTHEESNIDMTVELPIAEQIVRDYAFQTTPPALELIIHRFQRDAATSVIYWRGPVVSIVVANKRATLRVPSTFSAILQGNIPSVYVQPPCNHVLFDEMCGVSRVANSVDTNIVSVVGKEVTVASTGAFPAGWFVGGEVVVPSRNERRMVIAQAGTVLTVNYEFARLLPGEAVQIAAGCDHSYTGVNGCPKFNNKPRFGGCPFVPGEGNNPYTTGIK